ncbi:MAG: tetratricopeptide repeat protein [Chloroflexi bacterium]|nr:tetratricopeptide repeat protein [Chloroflexota bacterium]
MTDALNALRPLLGYGPDTLYFAFRQVAAPGLESVQSYDVTIDRSHNETWDTLTQIGWLGWLAYQFVYASVFAHGFRRLGLIATRRQNRLFSVTWIACTVLGALSALVLADIRYVGLGLGAGNVAAPIVFAIARALRHRSEASLSALSMRDQFLMVALLGSMTAHLLEIQFGLALVTTRIAFWMFAAISVVLGSGRLIARPLDDRGSSVQIPAPQGVILQAATSGLIAAAILCTLLFAFTTLTPGQTNSLSLIWRALTFNALTNQPSTVLPALLSVTWLSALALTWVDLQHSHSLTTRRVAAQSIGAFALGSLGLSAIFEVALAGYLSGLAQTPVDPADVAAVLVRSTQVAHVVDVYFITLLGVALLMALIALAWLPADNAARPQRRSGPIGAVILIGLGGIWLHFADLNPIRADVYHKLGTEHAATSPAAAAGLFRQAIRLAPQQDFYFLAWGRALVQQAQSVIASGIETPSRLSDQTRLGDVLALDDHQLAQLNRLDLLYAAQAALQQARALNPLYPDHTLNLARFYLPELPVNTAARSNLAALADDYYTQAVRLSPSNAAYWNEWAEFEQKYQHDPDRALEKLAQSLRLNPAYADTYLQQGQIYADQAAWPLARDAYQQVVNIEPHRAEAYSALAFSHYRLQELPQAAAAYQRYIELAPDAPNVWEAHKNLALVYRQLGDLTQALNELRLAAGLTTGDDQAQLNALVTQWQIR